MGSGQARVMSMAHVQVEFEDWGCQVNMHFCISGAMGSVQQRTPCNAQSPISRYARPHM